MRNFKRMIAGVTCLCTALSVCACGGGGGNDDSHQEVSFQSEVVDVENDVLSGSINIRVWDGGFGLKWLDNVIVAFEEKYPDVKIGVSDTVERQQIVGDVTGLSSKYDLVFSESSFTDYAQECLEPIDDVYAYTNKDESTSVGNKIMPIYHKYLLNKGHYYSIPSYVGTYGIVYNSDYIEDDEVPVTTEELKALCGRTVGAKPFIFSGDTGATYWEFIYYTWFAQYEGRDAYSASLSGQIIDANGEYKYDPSAAYLEGGLKAMQVCEDLLWYDNKYIVEDSAALPFIDAQRSFLKGGAVMMYNGSWLFNEMKTLFPSGTESEFKMMKTPVISAIKDKCTTIADDAELAALIRAIDAGETALTGEGYDVNEADFAKVSDARSFFYAGSEGANAVIPVKARNKELAKRFLTFMYSEEGIEAHASAKAGNVLPVQGFKASFTMDNSFMESTYGILLNNEVFFNNPIIAVDPLCLTTKSSSIEKQFGVKNAAGRMRAADSFTEKKNLWTKDDNDKFWNALISKGYIKERP